MSDDECTIDHRREYRMKYGLFHAELFHSLKSLSTFQCDWVWAYFADEMVECDGGVTFNLILEEVPRSARLRAHVAIWCPELPEIGTMVQPSRAEAIEAVKRIIAVEYVEKHGHHAKVVIRTPVTDE